MSGHRDRVEPTPDEIKNGWTAETLGRYLRERETQQGEFASEGERTPRGTQLRRAKFENTSTYDPHNWAS